MAERRCGKAILSHLFPSTSEKLHIFAYMKSMFGLLKRAAARLRCYISPIFVGLLLASLLMWYIFKLNYTYTAEFNVGVTVDNRQFAVTCVAEGLGSNLLGYTIGPAHRVAIPLSELEYATVFDTVPLPGSNGDSLRVTSRIRISPRSLRNAISVRFSDIKIVSVGNVPDMELAGK